MMLYVNGRDISRLVLGLGETDEPEMKMVPVGPEQYLQTLQIFLQERACSIRDVKRIIVVTGPGSGTALRTSLSIVNTIHFVTGIPVQGMVQEEGEQDKDTWLRVRNHLPDSSEQLSYAQPIYAQGPRVTLSTKDQLGRKKTG